MSLQALKYVFGARIDIDLMAVARPYVYHGRGCAECERMSPCRVHTYTQIHDPPFACIFGSASLIHRCSKQVEPASDVRNSY